jgi:hypothetical protein
VVDLAGARGPIRIRRRRELPDGDRPVEE